MRVKICGITRMEDAKLAVNLGAWALGFIFYNKSPRYIEPAKAVEIIRNLPAEVKKTGVFVNASYDELLKTAEISGIDTFQLHGEEKPELCAQLPYGVIKAYRPGKAPDLEKLATYKSVKTFLIDANVKGTYGGTGITADFELAAAAKKYGNIILAGGLKTSNILEAIEKVNPYAVDLSSGVELSPGIKDHDKLREFFRTVRKWNLTSSSPVFYFNWRKK